MARTRDEVVTTVARTFNVMLAVMLGEEAEPLALPNPIGPTMLSADDLTGDFGYFAQDAGSTPMSDDIKRQSLERLAPLLLSLGADPTEVREELVRTYDLPTALAAAPPPPPEPPALEEAPMAGPASDALPFPAPLGV